MRDKFPCCHNKNKDKISWETLNEVIPEKMKEKISDNRNLFVMRICMLILATNLFIQLGEAMSFVETANYFALAY